MRGPAVSSSQSQTSTTPGVPKAIRGTHLQSAPCYTLTSGFRRHLSKCHSCIVGESELAAAKHQDDGVEDDNPCRFKGQKSLLLGD